MPNGKVIIGYSFPMVGKYVNNNGTVTYTDSRFLARGVDCAIQPDQPSDTGFYADNIRAESDPGVFTGGTLNQTVDGLFADSETMIMGLPAATEDGYEYNDDQAVPYVGSGWVTAWQSGGVQTYTANLLYKVKYNQINKSAQPAARTYPTRRSRSRPASSAPTRRRGRGSGSPRISRPRTRLWRRSRRSWAMRISKL